ncbi:MAG: phosphoglycerate mutase, partial [Candidatus Omnitrophica bacterium]|nr:phosphoglycerate mutase [Candidatus Omnitrophota bacterium]
SLVNEFTHKASLVLNNSAVNKKRISEGKLAANGLLLRDAGNSLPDFPKLDSLYNINFGCFVEMPVERGIALLTGMQIVEVPSSTGHLDVDYPVWAKVALDALDKYGGLYIHIKGPDEPSHDGDFKKKKEIIQTIDKFFFGSFLSKFNPDDFILCVAADHCTPCALKAHTANPVPILVAGGNIKPDSSMCFSEKAAKRGSLGELSGQQVLPLLVKYSKL